MPLFSIYYFLPVYVCACVSIYIILMYQLKEDERRSTKNRQLTLHTTNAVSHFAPFIPPHPFTNFSQ